MLYLQGTRDIAPPRADLDHCVMQYRRAGGQGELEVFEGEAEGFVPRNPPLPATGQAIEKIIQCVHKQVW